MAKAYKAVAAVAIATLGLAACGGGSSSGDSETLIISTDLPLQGASKDASDATNQAIELYLEQIGYKAGDYTVELKKYDDSTAAAGKWDTAQCAKNATEHVENENEVAVMGTYNSGCAAIQIPVLNQDPDGPMLMVSQANTNPGLTQEWDEGEPAKYYPTSSRNYARVITTDDNQGAAAAKYMKEQGVTKVYILNDNEVYGAGVAKAVEASAEAEGITVLGNEAFDPKATNYTSTFQKIKAAGADAVYLAGTYDNNGGQLIKDKVATMGDNESVLLMAPDGYSGYPDLQALAESEGMFITFAGLTNTQLRENGGTAAEFLDAYKAKYGADPATNYALYGVQAVQVILAAIEASDGTRKGVRDAVFEGSGITISADDAILGKEIAIDPATGDVNAVDISVVTVTDGAESFIEAISLS